MVERIRRNCSDNIINDIPYKKRLIEYKAYLMRSGHSEKDIDIDFCKRVTIPRRETLKKKLNRQENNKIKFVNEYEPSFLNIYSILRKTNQLFKIMKNWKNIFKICLQDFQIQYKKGGKNTKEWLANTNINTIYSRNIVSYGCYDCGRNCIDCKYSKEKREYFYSCFIKIQYKVR